MKKIFNFLILITLAVILVSCKDNKPPIYIEDTIVKTEFVNKSKEYNIEDSNIDLLFLKESSLPLVNIKDYLELLNGAYISNEFEFIVIKDTLTINVSVTFDDVEYSESLEIDSNKDTILATSLDFFDLYLEQPDTNYSENLISLPSLVEIGNSVTFDLSDYDFDIINRDGNFYMPLVITNLIFNQSNYFDTYYNGEIIYGIDTSTLNESEIDKLLKSPFNSYKTPEDMKIHDYNFNRFIIDYFYGLKEDRNIDEAKSFIDERKFLKDTNKGIYNVTKDLDDLHTSHMTRGYYNNVDLKKSYTSLKDGPIITKFYKDLSVVQNEAVDHFGIKGNYINFKDYEYIDNNKTLIIYVLEFTVKTPNEIEDIIKNAKTETENIIIDLTFNTGGNLGAVLRMFALMTNEEISYHMNNPLNNERVTYRAKGERPAYDSYTYYLKTSSVTFSAANLASNIAKELGIKVIGRKSSGGASAISFFIFSTGSITIMSSNSVLSDKDYRSIEKGIEVDYHLNSLYNQLEIINAIKNLDQQIKVLLCLD